MFYFSTGRFRVCLHTKYFHPPKTGMPILKRQFSLIQYTLHTMLHEVQCLIFVCQEGKVKYEGNRVIDVYWPYTLLMNI